MASETALRKPNGYRCLAEEEVVVVRAMGRWVKDYYYTTVKCSSGTYFPLGLSLPLYASREFKRLSDVCYSIMYLRENNDSRTRSPDPENPYAVIQTTSLSDKNQISRQRLEAISAVCDVVNLRRVDYLTFQAWFLHHLGVEPSVCGIEEKYYRHLKHLTDTDEVVPRVEPLPETQQNCSLDRSGTTHDRLSSPPREAALQMNRKRRLKISESHRQPRKRLQGLPAPGSTPRFTSHRKTFTGVGAGVSVKVEETPSVLQSIEQWPGPSQQDMIPRAEHNNICRHLGDVIRALTKKNQELRAREARFLMLGRSWKEDLDRFLREAS